MKYFKGLKSFGRQVTEQAVKFNRNSLAYEAIKQLQKDVTYALAQFEGE